MVSTVLLEGGAQWEFHAATLDDGKCPVMEFLDGLKDDDGAQFAARFAKLVTAPPFTEMHTFKRMQHQGNMWEVLTSTHRILGFRMDRRVILTNGFRKHGNKTPTDEINRCIAVRKLFGQ